MQSGFPFSGIYVHELKLVGLLFGCADNDRLHIDRISHSTPMFLMAPRITLDVNLPLVSKNEGMDAYSGNLIISQ